MCVLLCANSKLTEWVRLPLAIADRKALQLSPVAAGVMFSASLQGSGPASSSTENVQFNETPQLHLMKRSAWLEAYWRYRLRGARQGEEAAEFFNTLDSAGEWQKALETLAKTWGRLLSLVGLR